MIKIRITWPALILVLIALLAYLARAPGQPVPARVPSHGRPARPRSPRPERAADFVIDQDGPAPSHKDETERLNRDAQDRARAAFEQTARPFEDAKERLNARHEQRQSRYARR